MAKYNILWLDDDFAPEILDENENQHAHNKRRKDLLHAKDRAAEYPDFSLNCVYDITEFKRIIQNEFQRYQAVIFDLRGLDPKDSSNKEVMIEQYEVLKGKPISMYIYSSYPKDEYFGHYAGERSELYKKGNVFSKTLAGEASKMFSKIHSDLEDSLQYYASHDECLQLFNEGFLDVSNKPIMDELIRNYVDRRYEIGPYNNMRQILEDMLNQLIKHGIIDASRISKSSDKVETFNKRIKYLAEECDISCFEPREDTDKKGNKKSYTVARYDYNRPKVSFNTCRREIRCILMFLEGITNRYSHFLEDNPNYLSANETLQDYNKLIWDSVYPAFFAAMKWFYGVMKS